MKPLLTGLFLLLLSTQGFAAFERRESGARIAALGGASAAAADDISSLFDNPAGLSFLKSFSASFTGYELFPDMSLADPVSFFAASAALPVHPTTVAAAGVRTFGSGLYRETEALASGALQFKRKFSAGISLKYLNAHIAGLPREHAFGIDAAGLVKWNEQFRIGALFRNLNGPILAGSPDNTSRSAECGAGWAPASGLFFTASLCLDADAPDSRLSLRTGSEWRLRDFLSLRAGFDTGRPAVTAGLGVRFRWITFDYAFQYSSLPGGQSVLSLSFDLSESHRSVFREERPAVKKTMTLDDLGPEKEYKGEKIDINTASAEELQAIPRIGPATARAIIDFREKHGPFLRKEDIIKVPRIGVKTFARFREFITVGTDASADESGREQKTFASVTLKELLELKIPPLTAVRILKYRDERGPVRDFEDLKNAEGVTPEDLRVIQPLIRHLFP